MASKVSALLLLFSLFSLSAAFNITKILEQYPDLSGFNNLLSQTKLADQINGRTTITILAVDGGGLGAANGLAEDVLKRVLSVHVILDYYDTTKLQNLKSKSISLTTLFQTTGVADKRQGFLNMTKGADGRIAFGSAMPGSPINSNLVKSVMSRPYNISVLQVSSVIVPPGITDVNPNTTHTPPPQPSPSKTAPTPAPSKGKKPTTPPPEADDSAATPADAPTKADPASPPADTPAADAPAADSPAAHSPKEDDSTADQTSRAGHVAVGASAGVAMMGALLLGL